MRALRFVGPGDDGEHVIVETTDGGEQFVLHLDPAMRTVTDPERTAPQSAPAPEPEAVISPREIQMRVRAGSSPQDIAEGHAMTLERVLRFAGPVLGERTRIADEARRAKARRSTTEGQTVVFGEAVDGRFTAHGIDPGVVTWDAHRRDDGQWIVSAGWVGGECARAAQWVFHLAARTVTPLDDTAADLLSDRPIRPINPPDEPVRPSLVAAPALAPGVVAFPPMPDARTAPLPTAAELDEVFDQDALDEQPRRAGSRRAQAAEPDPDFDTPPLPLRLADAAEVEPAAAKAPAPTAPAASAAPAGAQAVRSPKVTNLGVASRDAESDEERAARARIPSWDDILLGVRRKRD